MATSLMNDGSYAYEIQRNILSAAEIIFASAFSREKDLSLGDEELDELLISRREAILGQLRQEEAQIDAITGQQMPDDSPDRSEGTPPA